MSLTRFKPDEKWTYKISHAFLFEHILLLAVHATNLCIRAGHLWSPGRWGWWSGTVWWSAGGGSPSMGTAPPVPPARTLCNITREQVRFSSPAGALIISQLDGRRWSASSKHSRRARWYDSIQWNKKKINWANEGGTKCWKKVKDHKTYNAVQEHLSRMELITKMRWFPWLRASPPDPDALQASGH